MPVGKWPNFAACKVAVKAQYRKSHPKWTPEHLDQVAGAVCGQMEKQTRQGFHVAYQAQYEPMVNEKTGHFIKVYNIDDSWNGNGWAVTPQARKDSLTSFFRQPLLGPKHLSTHHIIDADPRHPHYGTHAVIGKPVDVINNGSTYGIYEVTVPEAWRMIQAGELGPVSPSVKILDEQEQPDGRKLITKFEWDHTLFVDTPAFPKAGIVGTCSAADPSLCGFAQAAQAAWLAQGVRVKTGDKTIDLVFDPADFKDVDAFVKKVAELGVSEEDARKAWTDQQQIVKGQVPAAASQKDKTDGAGYSPTASNPTDNKTEDTPGGVVLENSEPLAQAADAWSTADAPDKFFAVVPDSAKGPDGNKSDRKLPLASVQKKDYDEAIIKNALARLPQTDFGGTGSSESAAKAKICSAARSLGLDLPSCQPAQGQTGGTTLPDDKTEQGCKEAQAQFQTKLGQAELEIKDLKARLAARDDAELSEKALGVATLEAQAGLIKADKVTERVTELKKLGSAPALDMMQARYKVLVDKLQAAKTQPEPHRLKADFDEALKDPAQASSVIEQIRQASFGVTRTPEEVAKLEKIISGVR